MRAGVARASCAAVEEGERRGGRDVGVILRLKVAEMDQVFDGVSVGLEVWDYNSPLLDFH